MGNSQRFQLKTSRHHDAHASLKLTNPAESALKIAQQRDHEHRIAEMEVPSLSHDEPSPIHQAMQSSDAKAAVEKEWEKSSKSCQRGR